MKTIFTSVIVVAMFPFAVLGFTAMLAWGGFTWGMRAAGDIADDLAGE